MNPLLLLFEISMSEEIEKGNLKPIYFSSFLPFFGRTFFRKIFFSLFSELSDCFSILFSGDSSSGFSCIVSFFFNDTATTEIYTLSLHDALPICPLYQDICTGTDCSHRANNCTACMVANQNLPFFYPLL